jgi:hypothetical protein
MTSLKMAGGQWAKKGLPCLGEKCSSKPFQRQSFFRCFSEALSDGLPMGRRFLWKTARVKKVCAVVRGFPFWGAFNILYKNTVNQS